jgi:alpha-tubulin suppressor-like RCC1 family protein
MGDNLPFIGLGTDWQTKNIWGGSGHFCAHLLSGKIKCWGFNQLGQLGIGTINHVGSKADDMGDNLKAIDLGQDGN